MINVWDYKKLNYSKKLVIEEILNIEKNLKVYEKYTYFPAALIMLDSHVFHIVIGVREDGKTYGMLKEIIRLYLRTGQQSAMIYPTNDERDIVIVQKSAFDKLYEDKDEDIVEFLENISYQGEFIFHYTTPFVRFYSLNSHAKYKPQDHSKVGLIYYDEFARETYVPREAFKFLDLVSTIKRKRNDVKVVMTGNAISLNSPIFVALSVYTLNEGKIITLKNREVNDDLVVKIWNWKRPYEMIKQQKSDDPFMPAYEESGYADYAFKNNFYQDNMDNIISKPSKEMTEVLQYVHTVKAGEVYVNVYYISREDNTTGKSLYYFTVCKDPDNIGSVKYAINQEDVIDNVLFRPRMGSEMARKLQRNKFIYDSIITKQNIWGALKKRF